MPKMAAWAIMGVVILLVLGAVGYFIWSSKKKSVAKKHRQQSSDESASSDEDSSTGTGSDDDDAKPRKKRHGRRDSDEDYSLAKLDALGVAERRAVEDSIYSAAARNPFGLRGALAEQGRSTFELAKGLRSSGGSDSEAGQQLLRSRRGGRALDGRRV